MKIHALVGVPQKGDAFNDRMVDLVIAMGYKPIRVNIHKPGRELDILATHRLEDRHVLVECKAQEAKIGGADINKFVGALEAERQANSNISGYFVSQSGFKDSAIEQEQALPRPRCVLISAQEIERELLNARILTPRALVASRVDQISVPEAMSLLPDFDIAYSDLGWHWLLYFSETVEPEAVAVLHADGGPAPTSVVQMAREKFPNLRILTRSAPNPSVDVDRRYRAYVADLYKWVTYEGLPTDSTLSTVIDLDKLYVDTYLEKWTESGHTALEASGIEAVASRERTHLGEVLSDAIRVVALGAPGAGKSTMMRRSALAFARRETAFLENHGFSKHDRMPILIECRNLPASAPTMGAAIQQLASDISMLTALESESQLHSMLIGHLRDGQAVVFIDGLDEISDTSSRLQFVRSVRTFLSVYPSCPVVITSREPGFRSVSGVLADVFEQYKVSDLEVAEIKQVISRWFHLGLARPGKSREDALSILTDKVLKSDGVRRLTSNPLLLTTVLLVERWLGDIPRKRSVLYHKAIEVLLMTWNVEGHEPLDLDEAMPQLAHVAFSMSRDGTQRLSRSELAKGFAQARSDMPDVLAYSKISPSELIDRIESRSSLIIQSGFVEEHGHLTPLYEFKHLTFQEFLTSMAIVQNWLPLQEMKKSIPEIVASFMNGDSWGEIVPLTAIMAGRGATPVVQDLLDRVWAQWEEIQAEEVFSAKFWEMREGVTALATCLGDDVQVAPELALQALEVVIDLGDDLSPPDAARIVGSRYEKIMLGQLVGKSIEPAANPQTASLLGEVYLLILRRENPSADVGDQLMTLLMGDPTQQVTACGALMKLGYYSRGGAGGGGELDSLVPPGCDTSRIIVKCQDRLLGIYLADSQSDFVAAVSAWAIAWCVDQEYGSTYSAEILKVGRYWFREQNSIVAYYAAWLVCDFCIVSSAEFNIELTSGERDSIASVLNSTEEIDGFPEMAFIVLAYLSGEYQAQELRKVVSHFALSRESFAKRLLAII